MLKIKIAESESEIASLKEMFLEYAKSIDFHLCFDNFQAELNSLPGEYSLPEGILLIAENDGIHAGCIALRKLDKDTCEMKRLYVKPERRGLNIGRKLVEEFINMASAIGYKRIRLDTLPIMKEAQSLYKSFGFYEIPAYQKDPVNGSICMELEIENYNVLKPDP